ncbi:DoxX family protein [Actinomadura verrucosospora]
MRRAAARSGVRQRADGERLPGRTDWANLCSGCSAPSWACCSCATAYAYFTVHQPHALLPLRNGGESAAMFCWAFLLIAVLGPGAWALDALLAGRRREPAAAPSGS